MSLIKFNNKNRLFPWGNDHLKNFLSSDEFFNDDFFSEDSLMPAMNVKDTEDSVEVEFAAPGFSKKDFEVTIEDNMLHVSGEKTKEKEEKEEGYSRKEFNYNSFRRSLKLPPTVNTDKKVKAIYKDGILKLNLLKNKEAKQPPRKVIEVA